MIERQLVEEKLNLCKHEHLNKGVCIECGECLEICEFRDSYTEKSNTNFQQFCMRYLSRDPAKQNLSKIKKILIPLNLESYLHPVNDLILKTNFKGRLKIEDKIILSLLYLLKMNSFPLSLQDLLKFTTTGKYRLMKIYRNTFEFIEKSNAYFRGIYERTIDTLSKIGIRATEEDYNAFLSLIDKFKSTSPRLLCLAYFYEKYKIPVIKAVRQSDEFKYTQIQYVRKKIQKVNANSCI